MADIDKEDKFFLAFISVAVVILGILFGGLIVIALWAAIDAMTTKIFFIWTGILSFIAWASRKFYVAALKNNWIDKF